MAMKRNSTCSEWHRERTAGGRSSREDREPALELPVRSRTWALALEKHKEGGRKTAVNKGGTAESKTSVPVRGYGVFFLFYREVFRLPYKIKSCYEIQSGTPMHRFRRKS